MDGSKRPENKVEEERRRRHLEACEAQRDTYLDPESGYEVMTEYYLRRRGFCCGSGCRHCPYPREDKP